MKAVLLDDSRMFHGVLSAACEGIGVEVVACVTTVHELLVACVGHEPDLVLLDVMLQDGESGLDAVPYLRKLHGSPRVVVVSAHKGQALVRCLPLLGLHGFVTKDRDLGDLGRCLKSVIAGRMEWTTEESPWVVPDWEQRLTDREFRALVMVARLLADEEGAAAMGEARSTFRRRRNEVERILGKRGPKLLRYCREHGIDWLPYHE